MSEHGLPKNLLVVDDSLLQREFAMSLCQQIGISIIAQAEDGQQAIAFLLEHPQFELVILDLEMPGLDGVQVMQEMVRLGLTQAVIVASSRENTLLSVVESMGQSLGVKLLGVLQKPVTLIQLSACLSRFGDLQQADVVNVRVDRGAQLTIEDIATALRARQFVAYFQPKVSLLDGQLCGVEALIRWQHPQHGLLMPGQFIELIERSPHMAEVTLAMLDMSLQHCQHWHAEGLPLHVSINLAASTLADSTLADAIIERVKASGIESSFIILEITEGEIMTDFGVTLGTLARLRLNGFALSIDDYGTGFSGMLQLSRVPCSELKVDRAFVNGASQKLHLRIMLESALDIARKLNLKVVAEGVETREDWMLLRTLQCDVAQGYFIAKPMPGGALLAWWRANRVRLQGL
ncbi:MAG: EAL domain-containing response regulator [Pseudomonas sp.]|uniref:EAL domain-containing response regulator n=1 Tax=Pseudomonas sp. TaxID=306 RepID=UPI0027368A4B|nr:EAL domain-containing response regulator [Pseudomonas sp.]MDP3844929.1 EAL domain-containing response regulator [Pseudomonas sp.]